MPCMHVDLGVNKSHHTFDEMWLKLSAMFICHVKRVRMICCIGHYIGCIKLYSICVDATVEVLDGLMYVMMCYVESHILNPFC